MINAKGGCIVVLSVIFLNVGAALAQNGEHKKDTASIETPKKVQSKADLSSSSAAVYPDQKKIAKYYKDSVPEKWMENELFDPSSPSEDRWWTLFGDTILEKLIVWAVDKNYDLLMAADRMDQAQAVLRQQRSGFYPTIALEAAWTPLKQSGGMAPSYSGYNSQTGMAQATLSWEIDLIGSIRKRSESKQELVMASKSEYNSVLVSLCAQVASIYISLREAQKQLNVAQTNLSSQEEILGITEARYNSGLVSYLDVAQAKTVTESTRASIPSWESQVLTYCNALGVLLGERPWTLREQLSEFVDLPKLPAKVAVGVPAQALRQRPDIRAAESRVLAGAASFGATKADWWPKFYVNASFGYGSNNFKDFVNSNNMMWQIGPSVRWTIFDGLAVSGESRLAKAQLEETVHSYNQTVLIALEEVDNAMIFYAKALEQLTANIAAVVQSQLTLSLSLDLYTQGLADFQNVMDAQRYLLSYQNAKVNAEANCIQQLISLYKALGGGWKIEENQNSK